MDPTSGLTAKATSVPQITTIARLMSLLASPRNLTTMLGITMASSACQWKLLAIQKTLMLICSKMETRRCVMVAGVLTATPGFSETSISVDPSLALIAKVEMAVIYKSEMPLVKLALYYTDEKV